MKKTLLYLLILLSATSFAQLSGNYTIGGTSPDYATINEAVTDLNNQGISSSVTFNIRQGTYNEQIVISNINGSDINNTVTFQSETNNNEDVNITFEPTITDNYIILLDSASNIFIKDITFTPTGTTYGRIIHLKSESSNIHIENNNLFGISSSNYKACQIYRVEPSNGHYNNDIYIINNKITSGGGIYIDNPSDILGTKYIEIKNNILLNVLQYSIRIKHIFDNYTSGNAGLVISGNKIIVNNSNASFGVSVYYVEDSLYISNNLILQKDINAISNQVGIEVGYATFTNSTGKIFNNIIDVSRISTSTFSQNISNGIALSYGASDIDIVHNTISVSGKNGSYGIYLRSIPNSIVDNSIINKSTTYGSYIYGATSSITSINLSDIDYNNYYSYSDTIAILGSIKYVDFNDYITASATNTNSTNINSSFAIDEDYNVLLCGNLLNLGTPISFVTTDYNQITRNAITPTIGAIENLSNPIISINASTYENCGAIIDDTLSITPNYINANYSWTVAGNEISTEEQAILNIDTAGTYTYFLELDVCSLDDSVNLTSFPEPNLFLGNDTSICFASNITFDAGNFENYLWSNGSSDQTINVSTADEYFVEVTDTNNCTSRDTINLSINLLPTVDLGNDTTICEGESLNIDAGSFISYDWSNGDTTQTINVTTTNNYYVTVTDTNGCQNTDDINIDVVICEGINEAGEIYNISIYPNPASNNLYLIINNEQLYGDVQILDISGKVISSFNAKEIAESIDISNLQNGIYFIKLQLTNKTETLKFIKK